jgi:DegV family protein with EDD domain
MDAIAFDRSRLLIRGPALRRALISGARRVVSDRDVLNKINVFPVPDGDTGSNLAFTLGSVLAGALSHRAAGAGELLRRVGEDAIDGARGNSGAILAQFFTGVAEDLGERPVLQASELAEAVQAGARSARQAMADPREGTILSVIHAFAEELGRQPAQESASAWFAPAVQRARQALADTPRQLPVLQRAGVVDAGAKGFVDLLEGIQEFIEGGRAASENLHADPQAELEAAQAHQELSDEDPAHRWCSECLLLGEGLDRAGLRAAVADLGASCVVVAGSHSRIRLHAHVAEPQALFDLAARFGRVESTKADDMRAQARSAAGGHKVAIVTDSAADLPKGVAEELDIHVVPLRLNFGDQDYLDKVGLTPHEFYRKLREEVVLPRTSQPPPGDFRRQFEFLLSHHPDLIYLGVSRAVSGTIQSAETAAQRGGAPARPHVFDTANAAGGQALQAIAAAELARGGMDAAGILAQLPEVRARTHTWATTRDISHAVRGGRIPRWGKPLVQALYLSPVARVKPDGRLSLAGGMFGKSNIPARFAAYVARRLDHGRRWRVIVGHCDAHADGAATLQAMRALLDCEQSWLVETGPAVGAHAGPGALVISVQAMPEPGG